MFARRKGRRLEERRRETLSEIRGERLSIEVMVQRARQARETPDTEFLKDIYERLNEIEQRANDETDADELESLITDAQQQGQLRAYICPHAEIWLEGSMAVERMKEWKVPRAVIASLRESLVKRLQTNKSEEARVALRVIYEEYDSWSNYTDDYEGTMKKFTRLLAGVTLVTILLSIFIIRCWPSFAIFSMLLAGVAGSSISIMQKMPMLEVSPGGELESYERRIWTRVGVGVAASVIGSAILGWGLLPISIQDRTFASVLNACMASSATACTGLSALILVGVTMLLGFSERALTSFEGPILGHDRRAMTLTE
jgi:hypothetical protein